MQFGIVGLGLIGGSIAKALKARNFEVFAEDGSADMREDLLLDLAD